MEKQQKRRRRRKKQKIVRRILFSFAVIISIFGGHVAAKFQWQVNSVLNEIDRNGIDFTDLEEVNKNNLKSDDRIINLLLVGADKRESWKESGRSDSVMIATMDLKHKKLKVASLMRDMYVEIPGHQDNRFNAAYSFGGVSLLYQTIAVNFNIRLDGYVVVDFKAFKDVINTIGGVEVTLTEKEQAYLVKKYKNKKGTVADVEVGRNIMNGEQALAYTRIRQDAKGDFGRTERQRNVVQAIFKEVKSMSYQDVLDMVNKVTQNVSTDLTNDEIIDYVSKIILMGTTEIEQCRIPLDDTYTQDRIRNMAVLLPDFEANTKALHDFIYETD